MGGEHWYKVPCSIANCINRVNNYRKSCSSFKMYHKFKVSMNLFAFLGVVMVTSANSISRDHYSTPEQMPMTTEGITTPTSAPTTTTTSESTNTPIIDILSKSTTTIAPGEVIERHPYNELPNIDFPLVISNSCDKDLRDIVIRGMACTCDVNSRYIEIRDDYKHTPGIGTHKLHTVGASFNEARKICREEGAHLAIINSLMEEQVLIDMFKAVNSSDFERVVSTGEGRLGIHDFYKEGDWVTILGDSLAKTGYSKWGVTNQGVKQPDNAGGEHCAVLMIHEDGNGMNDVKCQMSYPFFCEIPEDQIA